MIGIYKYTWDAVTTCTPVTVFWSAVRLVKNLYFKKDGLARGGCGHDGNMRDILCNLQDIPWVKIVIISNKKNSIDHVIVESLLWLIGNLQVDVSRKKQFDWLQLSQKPMSSIS